MCVRHRDADVINGDDTVDGGRVMFFFFFFSIHLFDEILYDFGPVEHGGAMERRHFLHVARTQTLGLFAGLQTEHQSHYVDRPLSAGQMDRGGQVVLLRRYLGP